MTSNLINTRKDLDLIVGTPEHVQFMNMLRGTIYRLEKDDVNKTWVAVKDLSTIKQFGFTLKNFSNTVPPKLPVYISNIVIPESISMRQARLALLHTGHLDFVESSVGNLDKSSQIEWEFGTNVERNSPLVITLASLLGLTDEKLDALFVLGSTL